jgi:hypothetical protein
MLHLFGLNNQKLSQLIKETDENFDTGVSILTIGFNPVNCYYKFYFSSTISIAGQKREPDRMTFIHLNFGALILFITTKGASCSASA